MIIMKFGGSSLANTERVEHVGHLVKNRMEENPIIVLSAMGNTTNHLKEAGQTALSGVADISRIEKTHVDTISGLGLRVTEFDELLEELCNLLKGIAQIRELTPRTMDYLLSFGERLSIRIFSAYMRHQGINSRHYDGWEAGIVTSSEHTRAEIQPKTYENIAGIFRNRQQGSIPIIAGFIAKDSQGTITTLGRGGSDLTAAILGAALNAREIQVWKDVHGIMTADPRILDTALPIPIISYEEAFELAHFGAKVLHPQSILPAMKKGIPVRVKNSYDPTHPGTAIVSETSQVEGCATAITHKSKQVMVHICSTRMLGQYGFLAKVFQIFADLKISVDVIATSEVSLSLTLENYESLAELEVLLTEIAKIKVHPSKSIISLIGNRRGTSGILETALNTLSQENIAVHMISHGASHVNTSLVVDDEDSTRCLHLLHERFFFRGMS